MLIMSRKVEMGGKVGGEDKVMFLVEQMRCWEKHCQTPLFSVSPHFTPFQQGSGGGWVWGWGGVWGSEDLTSPLATKIALLSNSI